MFLVMVNSTGCNGTTANEDLWVVVSWSIILSFGLVTNFLLAVAIFRNRKLRSSTSYWLIFSLSICDIGMVLVSMLLLLPSTHLHDAYIDTLDWWNAFGIFFYDAFWYSQVLHLLLMAVNRYVNICQSDSYITIFSKSKTSIQIIVVDILGIAIAIPGLFPCCMIVYNHCAYSAQYNSPTAHFYSYVDITVNGITILVMLYCYAAIIAKVRRSQQVVMRYCRAIRRSLRQRNKADRQVSFFTARSPMTTIRRKEMRLFFQFCTVSAVFLLSWTTWQGLAYTSFNTKWVGFVVTTLFFLNNCTNPAIYLLFNATLRKEMADLLCLAFSSDMSITKTLAERTTFLMFPTVTPAYRTTVARTNESSSTIRKQSDDDELYNIDDVFGEQMVVLTPFAVPMTSSLPVMVESTSC